MNTTIPLDPLVSEFETQEQADRYDRWFRARASRTMKPWRVWIVSWKKK